MNFKTLFIVLYSQRQVNVIRRRIKFLVLIRFYCSVACFSSNFVFNWGTAVDVLSVYENDVPAVNTRKSNHLDYNVIALIYGRPQYLCTIITLLFCHEQTAGLRFQCLSKIYCVQITFRKLYFLINRGRKIDEIEFSKWKKMKQCSNQLIITVRHKC